MTIDDIAFWLLVIAAVFFIISAALLVYCLALLLGVQRQVRYLRPPLVVRSNEWPRWRGRV